MDTVVEVDHKSRKEWSTPELKMIDIELLTAAPAKSSTNTDGTHTS